MQRTANLDELAKLPPGNKIGELIDFADTVPRDLVLVLLPRYFHQAEKFIDTDLEIERAELTRHLVVLGALINRALFDVLDLPQDREHAVR